MPKEREFTVGTFYKPQENWKFRAYTFWYLAAWPGCIEYIVTATCAADAKEIAIQRRRHHEIEKERVHGN